MSPLTDSPEIVPTWPIEEFVLVLKANSFQGEPPEA